MSARRRPTCPACPALRPRPGLPTSLATRRLPVTRLPPGTRSLQKPEKGLRDRRLPRRPAAGPLPRWARSSTDHLSHCPVPGRWNERAACCPSFVIHAGTASLANVAFAPLSTNPSCSPQTNLIPPCRAGTRRRPNSTWASVTAPLLRSAAVPRRKQATLNRHSLTATAIVTTCISTIPPFLPILPVFAVLNCIDERGPLPDGQVVGSSQHALPYADPCCLRLAISFWKPSRRRLITRRQVDRGALSDDPSLPSDHKKKNAPLG